MLFRCHYILHTPTSFYKQLREDKIELENALEAESENHVNRLSRELGALRLAHQQLQQQLQQVQQSHGGDAPQNIASTSTPSIPINGHSASHGPRHARNTSTSSSVILDSPSASVSASPDTRLGYRAFMTSAVASGSRAGLNVPGEPTAEMMLEAMRRENEQLRYRLVDTERDYIRISRLNEVYREELIEHRRRVSVYTFQSC